MHIFALVTCTGINKYKAAKTTTTTVLGGEKNNFYSQIFIFSLLLRQQMFPILRNHRISHTLCICIFLPLTIDTKCSCTQNSPPAPLLFNYYNYFMALFTQIKLTSKCIFFPRFYCNYPQQLMGKWRFQHLVPKPTISTYATLAFSHMLVMLKFHTNTQWNSHLIAIWQLTTSAH